MIITNTIRLEWFIRWEHNIELDFEQIENWIVLLTSKSNCWEQSESAFFSTSSAIKPQFPGGMREQFASACECIGQSNVVSNTAVNELGSDNSLS